MSDLGQRIAEYLNTWTTRTLGDSRDLLREAQAENARLTSEVDRLRNATERARGCIKGLLARTPVRDVTETLSEIDAALGKEKK